MNPIERAALKRALSRARSATTLTTDICDIALGVMRTAGVVLVLCWLAGLHVH